MVGPRTDAAEQLRKEIVRLRAAREQGKAPHRRSRGARLSPAEREEVLRKTDARCHICGGMINGKWAADHVFAHSAGGRSSVDNFLPAHGTCNSYKWDYLPNEIELILKLGVWARTQIERDTQGGRRISEGFAKYEADRVSRRKKAGTSEGA